MPLKESIQSDKYDVLVSWFPLHSDENATEFASEEITSIWDAPEKQIMGSKAFLRYCLEKKGNANVSKREKLLKTWIGNNSDFLCKAFKQLELSGEERQKLFSLIVSHFSTKVASSSASAATEESIETSPMHLFAAAWMDSLGTDYAEMIRNFPLEAFSTEGEKTFFSYARKAWEQKQAERQQKIVQLQQMELSALSEWLEASEENRSFLLSLDINAVFHPDVPGRAEKLKYILSQLIPFFFQPTPVSADALNKWLEISGNVETLAIMDVDSILQRLFVSESERNKPRDPSSDERGKVAQILLSIIRLYSTKEGDLCLCILNNLSLARLLGYADLYSRENVEESRAFDAALDQCSVVGNCNLKINAIFNEFADINSIEINLQDIFFQSIPQGKLRDHLIEQQDSIEKKAILKYIFRAVEQRHGGGLTQEYLEREAERFGGQIAQTNLMMAWEININIALLSVISKQLKQQKATSEKRGKMEASVPSKEEQQTQQSKINCLWLNTFLDAATQQNQQVPHIVLQLLVDNLKDSNQHVDIAKYTAFLNARADVVQSLLTDAVLLTELYRNDIPLPRRKRFLPLLEAICSKEDGIANSAQQVAETIIQYCKADVDAVGNQAIAILEAIDQVEKSKKFTQFRESFVAQIQEKFPGINLKTKGAMARLAGRAAKNIWGSSSVTSNTAVAGQKAVITDASFERGIERLFTAYSDEDVSEESKIGQIVKFFSGEASDSLIAELQSKGPDLLEERKKISSLGNITWSEQDLNIIATVLNRLPKHKFLWRLVLRNCIEYLSSENVQSLIGYLIGSFKQSPEAYLNLIEFIQEQKGREQPRSPTETAESGEEQQEEKVWLEDEIKNVWNLYPSLLSEERRLSSQDQSQSHAKSISSTESRNRRHSTASTGSDKSGSVNEDSPVTSKIETINELVLRTYLKNFPKEDKNKLDEFLDSYPKGWGEGFRILFSIRDFVPPMTSEEKAWFFADFFDKISAEKKALFVGVLVSHYQTDKHDYYVELFKQATLELKQKLVEALPTFLQELMSLMLKSAEDNFLKTDESLEVIWAAWIKYYVGVGEAFNALATEELFNEHQKAIVAKVFKEKATVEQKEYFFACLKDGDYGVYGIEAVKIMIDYWIEIAQQSKRFEILVSIFGNSELGVKKIVLEQIRDSLVFGLPEKAGVINQIITTSGNGVDGVATRKIIFEVFPLEHDVWNEWIGHCNDDPDDARTLLTSWYTGTNSYVARFIDHVNNNAGWDENKFRNLLTTLNLKNFLAVLAAECVSIPGQKKAFVKALLKKDTIIREILNSDQLDACLDFFTFDEIKVLLQDEQNISENARNIVRNFVNAWINHYFNEQLVVTETNPGIVENRKSLWRLAQIADIQFEDDLSGLYNDSKHMGVKQAEGERALDNLPAASPVFATTLQYDYSEERLSGKRIIKVSHAGDLRYVKVDAVDYKIYKDPDVINQEILEERGNWWQQADTTEDDRYTFISKVLPSLPPNENDPIDAAEATRRREIFKEFKLNHEFWRDNWIPRHNPETLTQHVIRSTPGYAADFVERNISNFNWHQEEIGHALSLLGLRNFLKILSAETQNNQQLKERFVRSLLINHEMATNILKSDRIAESSEFFTWQTVQILNGENIDNVGIQTIRDNYVNAWITDRLKSGAPAIVGEEKEFVKSVLAKQRGKLPEVPTADQLISLYNTFSLALNRGEDETKMAFEVFSDNAFLLKLKNIYSKEEQSVEIKNAVKNFLTLLFAVAPAQLFQQLSSSERISQWYFLVNTLNLQNQLQSETGLEKITRQRQRQETPEVPTIVRAANWFRTEDLSIDSLVPQTDKLTWNFLRNVFQDHASAYKNMTEARAERVTLWQKVFGGGWKATILPYGVCCYYSQNKQYRDDVAARSMFIPEGKANTYAGWVKKLVNLQIEEVNVSIVRASDATLLGEHAQALKYFQPVNGFWKLFGYKSGVDILNGWIAQKRSDERVSFPEELKTNLQTLIQTTAQLAVGERLSPKSLKRVNEILKEVHTLSENDAVLSTVIKDDLIECCQNGSAASRAERRSVVGWGDMDINAGLAAGGNPRGRYSEVLGDDVSLDETHDVGRGVPDGYIPVQQNDDEISHVGGVQRSTSLDSYSFSVAIAGLGSRAPIRRNRSYADVATAVNGEEHVDTTYRNFAINQD